MIALEGEKSALYVYWTPNGGNLLECSAIGIVDGR